jgi:hypothetical protein
MMLAFFDSLIIAAASSHILTGQPLWIKIVFLTMYVSPQIRTTPAKLADCFIYVLFQQRRRIPLNENERRIVY